MRFDEILESAVDELKRELPSLKKPYRSTIGQLIDRISRRYRVEKRDLHKLFVNKYGESPDHWISKYQNKLDEEVSTDVHKEQVDKFVKWASDKLNLKTKPNIVLSADTEQAQDGTHTGRHEGDKIWVYIGNRNLIDIFRTIFHELVHHRQHELNMIKPGDSYPGSPIEAMADMLAGKYIKIYGKQHPEIFQ
jgi:hypothetical protein